MAYTYAQLKALWINNGGNAAAADIAAAVALAESGGDANATNVNTNGSIDRGLWQINSVHGSQSTFDVVGNVKSAIAISGNGKSWSPWTTFNTGAYKKFMSPTTAASASGTPPASANTTSLIPGISVSKLVESGINQVLKMLGLGSMKDMFERLGLIILGFALVILGIHLLAGGGSGGGSNVTVNEPAKEEDSSSSSKSTSGSEVKTASKKTAEKTGAEEAVEAAAVA